MTVCVCKSNRLQLLSIYSPGESFSKISKFFFASDNVRIALSIRLHSKKPKGYL